MRVDSPDTHRLRLSDDASVESDAGAVILIFDALELDEVAGADEEDDGAS